MSWIIGVLLVIAGAILGFFVAKFWLSGGTSGDLESQVEQSQKQLAVNKDYRSGQTDDASQQAPRDYTEQRSGLFESNKGQDEDNSSKTS